MSMQPYGVTPCPAGLLHLQRGEVHWGERSILIIWNHMSIISYMFNLHG